MDLLLNDNKINTVSNTIKSVCNEKILNLEEDIKTAIEKKLNINVN